MRKKILWSLVSLAVLLGVMGYSLAQNMSKTLVTISVASYDKLLADLGTIGQIGGNPDLSKSLDLVLNMLLTQGQGTLPLDKKQPWGAVLSGDGKITTYYAFLPLNNVKPLLEIVKNQSGGDYEQEGDIYKLTGGENPVYVLQKGAWTYIAANKEHLAKVETNPASLLGDLPKRYDVAVRASIKSLPKEYRDQFLAQLRAGAEVGMEQMPNESADSYAMRQNMSKKSIEQLAMLINETDELLLGWNIDAKTKTTYLDLDITAQPGTKFAKQLAEVKPGKTNFAGLLLPEAAVTATSVSTLDDEDVEEAKSMLATVRESLEKELADKDVKEEKIKLLNKVLDQLFAAIEKTIETKKTDSGMALVIDANVLTLVAGSTIVGGNELEAAIKELIDELKKSEDMASGATFSTDTVDGIKVHALSVDTPAEEMKAFVGDKLELALGIGGDKLFVAAGRDALKTIKTVITRSKAAGSKDVLPFELRLSIKKIAKFIAEVSEEEQAKSYAMMVASSLEMAGDKDHLVITTRPIEQGVRIRAELEEGILKVLGMMSRMLSPAPGMPQNN